MAAHLEARSAPVSAGPETFTDKALQRAAVSKLSVVHAELQETALLANLLVRSLYAGLVLAGATATTIAVAHASLVREVSWGLLMFVGVGALIWAYLRTIRSHFKDSALQLFAWPSLHAAL
jgi:hypothetical protein